VKIGEVKTLTPKSHSKKPQGNLSGQKKTKRCEGHEIHNHNPSSCDTKHGRVNLGMNCFHQGVNHDGILNSLEVLEKNMASNKAKKYFHQ
jgi:hypothetical protein